MVLAPSDKFSKYHLYAEADINESAFATLLPCDMQYNYHLPILFSTRGRRSHNCIENALSGRPPAMKLNQSLSSLESYGTTPRMRPSSYFQAMSEVNFKVFSHILFIWRLSCLPNQVKQRAEECLPTQYIKPTFATTSHLT